MAGAAWIEVTAAGAGVQAEIGDDGARAVGASGLAGLADRIAAAGGDLVIESGPGHGTPIAATLPIT